MTNFINPLNDPERYPLNDVGIGNAFADSFKEELRFVPEESSWYYYRVNRWRKDHAGLYARECAKKYLDYLRNIAAETENIDLSKMVAELSKNGARKIMLDEAKSVHPVSKSDLDTRKDLFNCLNYTIDLNTGEARPHNPNDFLTKIAPVSHNKDAKCDRWKSFTNEIMCSNTETEKYLQKALGYGITGETNQECLFLLYGPTTRNGKGTLMESITNVMGDYSLNMQPDSLAKRKRYSGSSASPDIARNAGVRLVNINEPAEDMVLDAAIVKQLTGSDTVTARFLYGNSFDYIPQFNIFISTNHLPKVTDDTLFSSGRIRVIPFNQHFEEDGQPKQDRSLKSLFRTDESKSAILNWLLEGLMMYRREGLKAPQSVIDATLAYRQTTDSVDSFVKKVTATNPNAKKRKTSEIYLLYQRWCLEDNLTPVDIKKFVGLLKKMNLVKRDGKLGNVVQGLDINYS